MPTPRRWWRGIRFRATAGALVAVGVALAGASVALLVTLRSSYVDGVRQPAELRAADLAAALDAGTPGDDLELDEGDDRFVQLVRDGAVVASSATAAASGPLDQGVPPDAVAGTEADDDWLVVTAVSADGTEVVVGREIDGIPESIGPAVVALAIGVPALLIVVGATTWLVVGRALAPVEAIRAEVDEIGGSDLDRRVPEPGGADEIARLATTMNAMLDRLRAARARQRRFVADASHELRSPVAAIRQHAEVALAHPARTTVPELASNVLVQDLRLQGLVDDLLVLTGSDDGGAALRRREVDLDDLVLAEARRAAVSSTTVRYDTSGIGAARVTGDERALARVIANLVDNATRHARSRVRVVSRQGDDGAVVEVHDDGPGIPEADRTRVLGRFVRLDEARARDAGGVGLGLAIVDEVVRAHGGRVVIDDSPLGGAAVSIRFPGRSSSEP